MHTDEELERNNRAARKRLKKYYGGFGFVLRMPPALGDTLALQGKASGRSLNQEIISRLWMTVGESKVERAMALGAPAPVVSPTQGTRKRRRKGARRGKR